VSVYNNSVGLFVGLVTAYNSGTGSMTILCSYEIGSGNPYSVWNVNLQGYTGISGSSGTSGVNGSSGTSGSNGSSGTSGTSGSSGTSGTSGTSGSSGSAGTSGAQGIGYYGLTSTTSNIIVGSGSKTWTTNLSNTQTAFQVGERVRAFAVADHFMEGDITAFSGTSLTINVTSASNTGNTYASWSFSITGNFGVQGASGSSGTSGVSITGPTGPTGSNASGGSSTIYNTVSRYRTYLSGNAQIWMESSSTVYTGLSWTRSTTTLTITHTSHGRSNGDMIIVRNANADNFNGTITYIDANSFSVATANSGSSSGSSAAYSLGFTSTSVTATGSTITAPSGGDVQLMSMLISDSMSGTYTLTTPQSSLNGSGQNDTIYNSYSPVWRVYTSGGATITVASMTLTATPNVFVWASTGTGDRNIRAQF
jgi:hypothetical protein